MLGDNRICLPAWVTTGDLALEPSEPGLRNVVQAVIDTATKATPIIKK